MIRPALACLLCALALACRTSASPAEPAQKPEANTPPTSLLAGFSGQPASDPVADEATRLSEGPLAECAAREAPNMQLAGDLLASKLGAGEVLEHELRLQPGACYTLLAVGGEGLAEVDVELQRLSPVRGKSETLAADTTTGTTAVLGGGGTCFLWSEKTATPARFLVRARAGSGVVVSQLYTR